MSDRERREDRHRAGQGVADREGRDRRRRMFDGVRGTLTPMKVSWWLKDMFSMLDDEASRSRGAVASVRKIDESMGTDLAPRYEAFAASGERMARAARGILSAEDHAGALAAAEEVCAQFPAHMALIGERMRILDEAMRRDGGTSSYPPGLWELPGALRFPHTPRQMADALHPRGA